MATIWGWTDNRPWQSHGDVGFVIRHGDVDDGDDDTDDDNDHKNDSYTAAGAAPGAGIINI